MSDFGLPERQIIGRVDLQKGMFAILEQPPCKYWNRLEDCSSASPLSIGIYCVLIGPLSIGTIPAMFLASLRAGVHLKKGTVRDGVLEIGVRPSPASIS